MGTNERMECTRPPGFGLTAKAPFLVLVAVKTQFHLRRVLSRILRSLSLLPFLSACPFAIAGNPLIPTVYSADPSAHVWPGDDRLWIYASHDQPGTNTHDTMISYHVFSSRDLVNWTDHGVVLHLQNVSWAVSQMWAIDCVKRGNLYHLVFCAREKKTGTFRTGLAISERPEGPFRDTGYIRGVDWGQDPCLFVDADDTPYLYWGAGGHCKGAKLTPDLREVVPGSVVDLTPQLKDVFEGPWVHRKDGKYYLSYPALPGGNWPQQLDYAIAETPLGPYHSMGNYLPRFSGQAGTNHGSITEYRGKWFAFHHSTWVSKGKSEVRNLMADELTYLPDGSIRPVTPSSDGVAIGTTPAPSRVVMQLEAENGRDSLGSLVETETASARPGFTGAGYVTGFDGFNDSVSFFAQSAMARKVRVVLRYASPAADRKNKVMVNYKLLDDPNQQTPTYDRLIVFPKSESWRDLDLGTAELKEGDNHIHVYSVQGGIEIDHLRLEPVTP